MGKVKTCDKCGVPLRISKDFIWQENGVIAQTKDPDHRLLFYECDNFDDLFAGIEELIGVPIEHIVVESKRRVTREYLEHQIPPLVRKVMHRFSPNTLTKQVSVMGRCYGLGDISLHEIRNKGDDDDFQIVSIRYPYSVPLFCGDCAGSKEGMAGRDFSASYEEAGEHTYLVRNDVGKHPIELQERLEKKQYAYKAGDLKYERCPRCGVPLGVARCHWNLEAGTIQDPDTGRRMVVIGPSSLEAIIEDLTAELGDEIPDITIEAQRRFVRKVLAEEASGTSRLGWREMVGLRGLGYVRNIDADERHITAIIDNSCLPLFIVGTLKGVFEIIFGHENTSHRWEQHEDGSLEIEVTAD